MRRTETETIRYIDAQLWMVVIKVLYFMNFSLLFSSHITEKNCLFCEIFHWILVRRTCSTICTQHPINVKFIWYCMKDKLQTYGILSWWLQSTERNIFFAKNAAFTYCEPFPSIYNQNVCEKFNASEDCFNLISASLCSLLFCEIRCDILIILTLLFPLYYQNGGVGKI